MKPPNQGIQRFIEKVNIRRQILLFLSAKTVLRASLAPYHHSPLINDCPLLDSSRNFICGRRQKKNITPTLIPPAAQGKFKPEWQTKNHYVNELAPLNRYLFIYLFIYLFTYPL